MSYQSDIWDAIQSSAPLTALIGDRFFWDVADGHTAPPYLVAQTVSGDGQTDMDGNREISSALVQFTAWAIGKAEAIEIIATLRAEMEGVALPGESDVSLHYAGENSTRDPDTRLYGEIIELRALCYVNQPST